MTGRINQFLISQSDSFYFDWVLNFSWPKSSDPSNKRQSNQHQFHLIWFNQCQMHFNLFLFLSFFSLNPINQSIKIRSINQLASAERWEMKWDEKEINESYNQQSQIRVSWQSINQINQSINQPIDVVLILFPSIFHNW